MLDLISYAFIYLIEAFIALSYFGYIFERKRSFSVLLCSTLIGYAACYGLFFLNSIIVNSISMFSANLIILLLNYNCNIRTGILQTAFFIFIGNITEVVVIMFLGVFNSDFSIFELNTNLLISICILSKLLYLIAAMFSARFFKPHKDV